MLHEIRIPRLGWSMEEGTFVGWLKRDGEPIKVGDPLFELEGEKALQVIESLDEGILRIAAHAPQPGTTVAVGSLLGHLDEAGSPSETVPSGAGAPSPVSMPAEHSVSSVSVPSGPAGPAVRRLARELGVPVQNLSGTGPAGRITDSDVRAAAGDARRHDTLTPSPPRGKDRIASPRARRTAREMEIDWTALSGTGRGGRIREADVRLAAKAGRLPSSETPRGQESSTATVIAISPRRKRIAERLRLSHERAVPVTLTTKIDATHLVGLRAQFKSAKAPLIPTYTDLVACLVVPVLQRHRRLAARWQDDRSALLLPADDGFHIGIAVDTPNGLLVPVLRNVGGSSLIDVATRSRALVESARAGRLTAAEMQGGVFTISNLGSFGIDAFTPILNDPEIGILGLGAIRREPVWLDNGSVAPRDFLTLSLTFDHLAVDGAPAADFLRDLGVALENPAAHLLGEK